MTIDTQLPASSAGVSTTKSFGTASVRLFAPQHVFELVRQQASAAAYSPRTRSSGALSEAANENNRAHQSSAA
jgi:hypothetical protein